MSLTTPLLFLDGIYRINYIPLIYHLIDLEHTTIPLTYLLFMDPGQFAKFAFFWDSRFTIQDCGNLVWIQALTDMGPWMTVKAWIQEVSPRILNLGSRKVCKICNFLGSVCVCASVCVCHVLLIQRICLCICIRVYIYIWSPLSISCSIIIPNHKILKR